MKCFLFLVITCLVCLIVPGVFAESLVSFNQDIKPNPYATDDVISRAGTLNIPAGIGILTTNEIIQPYWASENAVLPVQIEFSPVDPNGPQADLEVAGIDAYQLGNEVHGLVFSNGLPLNIVTTYVVQSPSMIPYYIILRDSSDKGSTIQEYKLVYSAEYKPVLANLSSGEGYPSGIWKTNGGDLNLTDSLEKVGQNPYLRGSFADGNHIEGALAGPIWFGSWSQNETETDTSPGDMGSGQFIVTFNDEWSAFSGTKGTLHSCSDDGSFSGEKGTP